LKNVLCIDIEGGYGGSSRSLYNSLAHLPENEIKPEVWCRRSGPIQEMYNQIYIANRVEVNIPSFSSLPRFSRNLYNISRYKLRWGSSQKFRARLLEAVNQRFDIVHFNHEGLFCLAHWLRFKTDMPFTMHIRTNLLPTVFSRAQAQTISNVIDHTIFITENEQNSWKQLGLKSHQESVIYNIAGVSTIDRETYPELSVNDYFKVAILGNFAWIRGMDRLVEVASELVRRGRIDILFVVAGDMRLRGNLSGELNKFKRNKKTLEDYVNSKGLGHMFRFLGHITEPDRLLVGCDVLLRLSRENNPWGRDVIEALGSAKPVIATGKYDTFVKSGKTGILLESYSPNLVADNIIELYDDKNLAHRLGTAGKELIDSLCNGSSRATELAYIWNSVVRK